MLCREPDRVSDAPAASQRKLGIRRMPHHANQPDDRLTRQFLSPAEFSQRAGVSLATVHRYLKRGLLPCWQPAGKRGRILIPISALASILSVPSAGNADGSAVGPTPESPSSNLSGPRPRWARQLDSIQNEEKGKQCPPEGKKNG